MTEQSNSTTMTLVVSGEGHEAAADALVIQFSDGGMDEDIEQRLAIQGYVVDDTDFNLKTRELFVKLSGRGDA